MDLNFIFFPVPKKRYTKEQHEGELIWIPKIVWEESKQQVNCNNKNHNSFQVKNTDKSNTLNSSCRQIQDSTNNYFGMTLKTRIQFQRQPHKKEELEIENSMLMPENETLTTQFNDPEEGNLTFMDDKEEGEQKHGMINTLTVKTQSKKNNFNAKENKPQNTLFSQLLSTQKRNSAKSGNYYNNNASKTDLSICSMAQENLEEDLALQSPQYHISNYDSQLFQSNNFSHKSLMTSPRVPLTSISLSSQNNINNNNSITSNQTYLSSQNKSASLQNINNSSCNQASKVKPAPFLRLSSLLAHSQNQSKENNNNNTISQFKSSSNFQTTENKYSSQQTQQHQKHLEVSQQEQKRFFQTKQESFSMSNRQFQNNPNNYSSQNQNHQQSQPSSAKITKLTTNNNKYYPHDSAINSLTWTIPRDEKQKFIPCLFLRSYQPSNYIMIYFHGNGEDISLSYELTDHIRKNLQINVLAVEYQGYGLYEGSTDENQIIKDTLYIYNYLTLQLSYEPNNILVMGRSIGTGPATWLAANKTIGALVLVSGFTSLRGVVKHVVGSFAQHLIKERFVNVENISRVICPTFILHGKMDALIPYSHSQQLHDACKGFSELHLPKKMTHTILNFNLDLTIPLQKFLISRGVDIKGDNAQLSTEDIIQPSLSLYQQPNLNSIS